MYLYVPGIWNPTTLDRIWQNGIYVSERGKDMYVHVHALIYTYVHVCTCTSVFINVCSMYIHVYAFNDMPSLATPASLSSAQAQLLHSSLLPALGASR
jgi:hypothetical protein